MYELDIDDELKPQLAGLTDDQLMTLADVLADVCADPWNGRPHNINKPLEPLRQWDLPDGGFLTYLIVDWCRRVDLLRVVWLDA